MHPQPSPCLYTTPNIEQFCLITRARPARANVNVQRNGGSPLWCCGYASLPCQGQRLMMMMFRNVYTLDFSSAPPPPPASSTGQLCAKNIGNEETRARAQMPEESGRNVLDTFYPFHSPHCCFRPRTIVTKTVGGVPSNRKLANRTSFPPRQQNEGCIEGG